MKLLLIALFSLQACSVTGISSNRPSKKEDAMVVEEKKLKKSSKIDEERPKNDVEDKMAEKEERQRKSDAVDWGGFDDLWTERVEDRVEKHPMHLDDISNGGPIVLWCVFAAVVAAGTFVDLVALKSFEKVLTVGQACKIFAVWIVATAVFVGWIGASFGMDGIVIWLDGYVLETMLSVDNLFVFVLIMRAFSVPQTAKGKVLMIGVIAAILLRVVMFGTLALLISYAEIITKALGVFIIFCAYKIVMLDEDDEEEVTDTPAVQLLSKIFPISTASNPEGHLFIEGAATSIFLACGALVFLDVVFAIDSVSAKSALISNLYLNYTSTGFAMFALRAQYALLESAADMFEYLKYGISAILAFIGLKTILPDLMYISDGQYLVLLVGILVGCILLSIYKKDKDSKLGDKTKQEKQPIAAQ